jgi:hypothetical protein
MDPKVPCCNFCWGEMVKKMGEKLRTNGEKLRTDGDSLIKLAELLMASQQCTGERYEEWIAERFEVE